MKPLHPEVAGRLEGADAGVAEDDDLVGGVGGGLGRAREELQHRDVLGAGQAADIQLLRLADVDQVDLSALVEPRLDLANTDFLHAYGYSCEGPDVASRLLEFFETLKPLPPEVQGKCRETVK